eukprot:4764378-Pyramimonas_sp.AAC.1
MAHKVWSTIRSQTTCEWSASLSACWDTAIAGSSALRAALIRAVLDEGAHELSFEHATLFLDLTKFHDYVSFVLLMRAGMDIGFPPIIMLLEICLYSAPSATEERPDDL